MQFSLNSHFSREFLSLFYFAARVAGRDESECTIGEYTSSAEHAQKEIRWRQKESEITTRLISASAVLSVE